MSRDRAVDKETGYGLDDRGVGVRVPIGVRFSLLHIVQTGSGPTQPLFNGHWRLSPGVKLTTHLQPVRGQEYVDLHLHSPICHHDIVFN
jgi:hypothetical protein